MPTINPKIYVKSNKKHREVAEDLLERRSSLFQWNNDGSDAFLDIGCGPGDITVDFILPVMPKNLKVLVGADVSQEMIEYCQETHKNALLKFCKLDIGQEIPEDTQKVLQIGSFSNITSFFTLHLVKKQKQALKNIFNFLIPNGACLLTIVLNTSVIEIMIELSNNEKYKNYMTDIGEWFPTNFYDEKPVEIFESYLKETGFQNFNVEIKDIETFYDEDSYFAFISIYPYMGRMSDELKADFVKDIKKLSEELEFSTVDQKTGEKGYRMTTKLMYVEAQK